MALRRRVRLCEWILLSFSVVGSYVSSELKLLCFSALLYSGLAALNVSSIAC